MNKFEEHTQWDVVLETEEPEPVTLMEHINYFFFGATEIALSDGLIYYGTLAVALSAFFIMIITALTIVA